ncbi:BglG family transcription antiterminator [Bacillota bacterium Lsc_1132]
MNDRQKAMLIILLEETAAYLSSQQLADRLNCSEKTVRNDSKLLDQWLAEHSQVVLTRKPNAGFKLDIREKERNTLLQMLTSNRSENKEVGKEKRVKQILQWLLIEKKTLTLQKLSESFFVNKAIIKKDLEKIERFLQKYDLQLSTKKKLGIEIEGNERDFRLALSKIPEFLGENQNPFWQEWFLPYEISAVKQLVEELNEKVPNPYTDQTLQNLVIHILISLKRLKQGNLIQLPEVDFAKIKQKMEYRLAEELLKQLEKKFSMHIPKNEIAYIAMHLMGGKAQKPSKKEENINDEVSGLTKKLIDQLSDRTHIEFEQDADLLSTLNVHLKSTLNRLKYGLNVSNPLLDKIKRMYPYLFNTIMAVLVQLNKENNVEIPEEEAAFITLHFQASLERLQKKSGKNQRAIIVCPMGIGTSTLLRAKLDRKFHSLKIIDSVSMNSVNQYSANEIDFIISTLPLNHAPVPVIVVSPLLTNEEEEKIATYLENGGEEVQNSRKVSQYPALRERLKSELILLDLEQNHRFEIIEAIGTTLFDKGYIQKEYIETAVIREKLSSTCIGGGVAIPHGDPSYIVDSAIEVGILKKPILWGNDYVSLVFLLAMKQEEYTVTKELFAELGKISENPLLVNNLIKQNTTESFLKLL